MYAALLIWCAIRLLFDELVIWQVETVLGLAQPTRLGVCAVLLLAAVLFVFPKTTVAAGLLLLALLLVAWKLPLRQAIFNPGLHLVAIGVLLGWRFHYREEESIY